MELEIFMKHFEAEMKQETWRHHVYLTEICRWEIEKLSSPKKIHREVTIT